MCDIRSLPDTPALLASGALSALAWCSLAGNPACAPPAERTGLGSVDVAALQLGAKLGDGASGEVCSGERAGGRVPRVHASMHPCMAACSQCRAAATAAAIGASMGVAPRAA